MTAAHPTNRLTQAFIGLRNLGYFARQSFKCCMGCGCSALPEGTKKWVFYHNQDNDDRKEGKPFYLCWGGDGNEIVTVLRSHGFTVKWDGDPNVRICIVLKGGDPT